MMNSSGKNIIAEKQDTTKNVVINEGVMKEPTGGEPPQCRGLDFKIFLKCDKKELDKLLAEREEEILRARDAEYFETIKRLKEKSNNDCMDEC